MSAKTIFVLSLTVLIALGAFGYGVLVGGHQWWPYEALSTARSHITTLVRTGELAPSGRSVPAAPNASRDVFKVYDAHRVLDGLYAVMGFDGNRGGYAIRLYDHRGGLRHTWPLDYAALDADGPRNRSDSPHGMEVLPDGSVVVGFDKGDVIARIDQCAAPIWIRPGIFHHAIERDENGDLWAWRGEGTAYSDQQYIVRIDVDSGEILEEIDFLRDVVKAQADSSFIFSVRQDYPFRKFEEDPEPDRDLFHPNDVEVLPMALADRFPQFRAGDLLISLRNVDLVAVLDRGSHEIKWWSRGPWHWQHDPDFTPDGMISVFDNNSERGRSEILKIDPGTMAVRNELWHGDLEFFTYAMGKHSYLPNGNVLVVSPAEGRVIEVSAEGERVLEINNVINERFNGHVENGVWLPADYFDEMPAC